VVAILGRRLGKHALGNCGKAPSRGGGGNTLVTAVGGRWSRIKVGYYAPCVPSALGWAAEGTSATGKNGLSYTRCLSAPAPRFAFFGRRMKGVTRPRRGSRPDLVLDRFGTSSVSQRYMGLRGAVPGVWILEPRNARQSSGKLANGRCWWC
jgi:hypothetical protein